MNSSTTVTFASISMAESKMVSLALLVFLGAKEDREGVHGGGGGWESGFLYHKSWAETMKWIIIIIFMMK